MSLLEIRVIDSLDRMVDVRPQWNHLSDRAFRPTVFSSWEWQYLAAKYIAEDQTILVPAVYDDDTLVAVLPLRQGRMRLGGMVPVDVLCCLGGAVTDYNPLLVDESRKSGVIPVLAEYLRGKNRPIQMENVLPGSALDSLGAYLTMHGFRKAEYESKTALVSEVGDDYETFMKTRTRKFRKTLRDNQNYMDRTGGYTYHTENPSEELLETLIRLHSSRWQLKGEKGALVQRQIINLHLDLMTMNDRTFDIRYYTIRHEGSIIAILYGFLLNETFYAYLSGFDMRHNRISPGNMVFNHCIRELHTSGARAFDMLRGDMKYKQTWATAAIPMIDAVYFPPTGMGRLLHATMKTIQGAKRALPTPIKQKVKAVLSGHPTAIPASHRAPDSDDA